MPEFAKIPYYDLKLESAQDRLPLCIGREEEIQRLSRITGRNINHNALVIAPNGSGRTSLLYGWAAKNTELKFSIALLDSNILQKISLLPATTLGYYLESFAHISNAVVIIDNLGDMIYGQPASLQNWHLLLKVLLQKDDVRIIASLTPQQYEWLKEMKSPLLSSFESIQMETQKDDEQLQILGSALEKLHPKKNIGVSEEIKKTIVGFVKRFPSLGTLPTAAIELLDECMSETIMKKLPSLNKETVEKIVSEKTGVPLTKLSQDEKQQLKKLQATLSEKVIGQQAATSVLVGIIQRARLGLRNPNKPLGSFLCLGPSGVGKTETAKILAEELYGSSQSFLRIDMSEFGEAHTVARLVGSPAGYVGYEEGGQLTNHFKTRPYSLVLLDEVEKAHPKIFDIFLQMLDDGRLTSARGETADFTQAVVMATSNLGVTEILSASEAGRNIHDQDFTKEVLMPVLLKHFRPEFLNRFDGIVVYKPLTVKDLVKIALLEIKKIEARVKEHNIQFSITPEVLEKKIVSLYDPRFGARPVKRFVEEVCETLITKTLLQ